MTDQEQIQRDTLWLLATTEKIGWNHAERERFRQVADQIDALLAELKQTERERDRVTYEATILSGAYTILEAKADKLTGALADAVWAADYLAEQQAMQDDGYKERLERARASLADLGKKGGDAQALSSQ
jgi:cell division protein ZapA (FtsZ GTPase activity inhibitor)